MSQYIDSSFSSIQSYILMSISPTVSILPLLENYVILISTLYFLFLSLNNALVALYTRRFFAVTADDAANSANNPTNNPTLGKLEMIILFLFGYGMCELLSIAFADYITNSFVYLIFYYDIRTLDPTTLHELKQFGIDLTSNYPYIYQTVLVKPILLKHYVLLDGSLSNTFNFLPLDFVLADLDSAKPKITINPKDLFLVPKDTLCTKFYVVQPVSELFPYLPLGGPKQNPPEFYQIVEFSWDYYLGHEKSFKALSPFINGEIKLPQNFYPTSYEPHCIKAHYDGPFYVAKRCDIITDLASAHLPPRKQ